MPLPLNGDSHEQRFQSQRLDPIFAEPDRDVKRLFPSRMAKRIGAMERRRGEDGLRFSNRNQSMRAGGSNTHMALSGKTQRGSLTQTLLSKQSACK
ncbi:hypothetical protein CO655_30790 [Rhizobium sp. M1]|nr:hypothetical protein CO655_30790 [Rhizobium sp. M1]